MLTPAPLVCVSGYGRYRSNIQQTLDYYQRLQDLTKQFNKSADDFVYAVDEIADDIAEPIDGTTVEQLTAIVDKFNTDVKPRVDGLNEQYQAINAVVDELTVRVYASNSLVTARASHAAAMCPAPRCA